MPVVVHSTRPAGACKSQVSYSQPPTAYYRRLPESALVDRRLPRSALALLAYLDAFARDKAECWPSVARLAADLGYCRRSIQLALGALKEHGYVDQRPAENPTGRALILLWKRGAQAAMPSPAQMPYTQGLPRGRKPIAPEGRDSQGSKMKGVGSALQLKEGSPERPPIGPPERPPTPEERAATLREYLGAVPLGSALGRLLEGRLKTLEE